MSVDFGGLSVDCCMFWAFDGGSTREVSKYLVYERGSCQARGELELMSPACTRELVVEEKVIKGRVIKRSSVDTCTKDFERGFKDDVSAVRQCFQLTVVY